MFIVLYCSLFCIAHCLFCYNHRTLTPEDGDAENADAKLARAMHAAQVAITDAYAAANATDVVLEDLMSYMFVSDEDADEDDPPAETTASGWMFGGLFRAGARENNWDMPLMTIHAGDSDIDIDVDTEHKRFAGLMCLMFFSFYC